MKKIKENINLILYFIITIPIIILMFWAISQKEGFHEDEIFSYGASNSSLANVLVPHGKKDVMEIVMQGDNIFETVKNVLYYKVFSPSSYEKEVEKIMQNRPVAIWRTNLDAREYLQIDNFKEAIDFKTVWWNTAKDVHPPLFYFAVHIVSILFFGRFSKYIIFSINIIFFALTIIMLRKILVLVDKKHLTIPNLILYGASIGAISTVVFQRMYMMLTFFTLWLLYINLKIYINNFELTKSKKKELGLCIILGFMTQYYFCFYAIFSYLTMLVIMLKKKEKKNALNLFKYYLVYGIIAVLLFLPSLNHMFFSYRGISSSNGKFTFINKLISFIKNTLLAYSLPLIVGTIVSSIILILLIIRFIRSNYKTKEILLLLFLPIILYFIVVVKFSPYKSLRYVMNILPIISMIVVIVLDDYIKNKKVSITILSSVAIMISIYGLFTNPIKYLYKGSSKNLEIAKKYKNDRFLLVCFNEFNHIKDAQEFCIYKEFMVVPPDKLEFLKEVKEFKEDDELILAIKNWSDIDKEEVLQDVLEYSPYENYKLLYTSEKGFEEAIYLLTK